MGIVESKVQQQRREIDQLRREKGAREDSDRRAAQEKRKEHLDKPWREGRYGEMDSDALIRRREEVLGYNPPSGTGVETANILLVGRVGAGKTSVCNSAKSISVGHVTAQGTAAASDTSVTKEYRMYRFRTKEGGKLNFRLCDTMGIEDDLTHLNLPLLLDGYVSNRFKFTDSEPLDLNAEPTLQDKVHVVAFVIDSTTVNVMNDAGFKTVHDIRDVLKGRGIPMVLLVTKLDKVTELTARSLKNVYYSKTIRDIVDRLSLKTGTPRNQIFPIQNYESQTELRTDVDIVMLTALTQMLHYADDHFDEVLDD